MDFSSNDAKDRPRSAQAHFSLTLPAADEIDRYYTEIAYDFDNISGPTAQAFNLIRSLEGFPCDKDGNGNMREYVKFKQQQMDLGKSPTSKMRRPPGGWKTS